MTYILCIETSTTNCSVALSKNGVLIALKEDNNVNYSHAESLHLFIEALLIDAKIELANLHAIAISKGPGSYTGLRIGVSAAKGLCYALNIPLIAINTLTSLAHQAKIDTTPCYIVPMLDARRMEVFTATYNETYQCVDATNAYILEDNSYLELLTKQKTVFIGNGVAKFRETCTHPNAIFIEDALPSASQLATLSFDYFKNNQFEDVAYFEPYYLKDFIAGKPKAK